MCGICGVYENRQDRPIDTTLVESMCEAIAHRGPNSRGCHFGFRRGDGAFRMGLGHRRLAIVDIAAGQQPLGNEDKSVWVVCDGEIYNHHELRSECIEKGHTFRTNSDTEVLVHLYEEYGVNCLSKVRGMFACSFWDESRKRLFMARDRMGIKPLYYTSRQGRFSFASEIKGLLCDKSIPRELRHESFYQYVAYGAVAAPYTLFEGIMCLPAGHFLVVDLNTESMVKPYWSLADQFKQQEMRNDQHYEDLIYSAASEAVASHSTNGEHMGVFLSGGVDSSLITALLTRSGHTVSTFSTGFFDDDEHSELENARQVAKLFNTDHSERIITKTDFSDDVLAKVTYHQEIPISPVCVAYYLCAQHARERGIKVAYIGEGSDELFYGYDLWVAFCKYKYVMDIFRKWPKSLQRCSANLFALLGGKNSFKYEIMERLISSGTGFWGSRYMCGLNDRINVLNKDIFSGAHEISLAKSIQRRYADFIGKSATKDERLFISYLDLTIKMPELFLCRMDRMSMAHAVEVREPFLDHRFVEKAAALPFRYKVRGSQGKYLLKQVVKRFVPDDIVCRRKLGWGSESWKWYAQHCFDSSRMMDLVRQFNKKTFLFDLKYIESWSRSESLQSKNKLYALYSFVLWYERFIS